MKNFDKWVKFLAALSFNFNVIFLSEIWCSNEHNVSNLFKLLNCSSVDWTRSSGKTSDGLALFVHNSMKYIVRKDVNTNNEDIQAVCLEIINALK